MQKDELQGGAIAILYKGEVIYKFIKQRLEIREVIVELLRIKLYFL
ncbi:MAG: hypothetical protein RCG16_04890 [Rickettsia hoogstraalii]